MYRPAHCGQSPKAIDVVLSGDSKLGEHQENGLLGPRVRNDGFLFRIPARCRSAKSHLCTGSNHRTRKRRPKKLVDGSRVKQERER